MLMSQPGELHTEQRRDHKRRDLPCNQYFGRAVQQRPGHPIGEYRSRQEQAEGDPQWPRASKPRSADPPGDGCAGAYGKCRHGPEPDPPAMELKPTGRLRRSVEPDNHRHGDGRAGNGSQLRAAPGKRDTTRKGCADIGKKKVRLRFENLTLTCTHGSHARIQHCEQCHGDTNEHVSSRPGRRCRQAHINTGVLPNPGPVDLYSGL